MTELDWKDRKERLDRLASKQESLASEDQTFLLQTVAALVEEAERLHKRELHLEERTAALSKQITVLESRVHEEVD